MTANSERAGDRSDPQVPRVLVVTGSDTNQVTLLRMMLQTLRAQADCAALPVACIDVGLSDEDRLWLERERVEVVNLQHRFDVPGGPWPRWLDVYLVQPFFRELLPGWDIYLWADADLWFQDNRAIRAAIDGAQAKGLAIAHERTAMYRRQWWLNAWMTKHFIKGFGPMQGLWLATRPHLNSGFYALHANAPHWNAWIDGYQRAMHRAGSPTPQGQFTINQMVWGGLFGGARLTAEVLEPWANWICDRGPPMWNDAMAQFCEPAAPHRPLSVLHLAGPGKHSDYEVRRSGGGSFRSRILPGASPQHPILAQR